MCFPNASPAQPAVAPPSYSAAQTQQRIGQVNRTNLISQQTVLTTPLGDPNFGKSVNRTVLTGSLT